jgi:Rrf2 family protein
MKLGKESRYAVEGLVVLAQQPFGTTMQLREIAAAAGVPANFLAKIFQKLGRANILASSRGAVRGYALARRANTISVKDVFVAVEGGDVFDRCIFWSDRCADLSPCPMHNEWKKVRQAITQRMQGMTLAGVARQNPAKRRRSMR